MNPFVATVVALLSVSITCAQAAGDPAKAQAIVNQVCAACHSIDGNSLLPANPSLAGQHPEYLFKQLTEFKSGTRVNAVMTGMVANLTAEDMRNLAAYYSAQIPKQMAAKNKDLVTQGRKLYRGGNAANGLAACAGCHSPNGAGIPAQYPRLASQHAEYVAAQLKAFRAGDRANDPLEMMQSIAVKLTDKDIAALAEYISGLH
jgi:cytochrome c553